MVCRNLVAEWTSAGCAAIHVRSDSGRWEEAYSTMWYAQLAEQSDPPRMEPSYVGSLQSADETITLDRMLAPRPAPRDTATFLVYAKQPLHGRHRSDTERFPLRWFVLHSDTVRALLTFVPRGESPAAVPRVVLTFRHLKELQ